MEMLDEDCTKALLAAGAISAIDGMGLAEKDAEAVVNEACKQAARRVIDDDDEDDDDSTWWSRNKRWALPTAIGAGAFLLGANSARAAERAGTLDKGNFYNAGSYLYSKLKALLGISDNPWWKYFTNKDEAHKAIAANEATAANKAKGTVSSGSGGGSNAQEYIVDPKTQD